jgi:hypothetical protein
LLFRNVYYKHGGQVNLQSAAAATIDGKFMLTFAAPVAKIKPERKVRDHLA